MTIFKHPILRIMLVALLTMTVIPSLAQDTTPEAPCQDYRLTSNQGRVYSEPSADAELIGGASRTDTLCIQGIAVEDASWLIIKLEDGASSTRTGYIQANSVEAGRPGQETGRASFYCDAYSVRSPEVNVRAGPSTSYAVLDTFSEGTVLCVEDYLYLYDGWVAVSQPGTGATGWVDSSYISYRYNESLGCASSDSGFITESINLHTCPGRACTSATNLPANTEVCIDGEAEEDRTWVQFPLDSGRNGWMVLDLLEPLDDVDIMTPTPLPTVEGEATATPLAVVDCTMYRVNGPTDVRVREQATTSAIQIASLPSGSTVCVMGQSSESPDWLEVNLSSTRERAISGFVFASLLTPVQAGTIQTVSNVEQPARTPTAVPIQQQAQQPTQVAQVVTPLATQAPINPAAPGVQICPVGAIPVDAGACITVTPTNAVGIPELQGNGLRLARDVKLEDFFLPNVTLTSPESNVTFFFQLPDDWIVGTPTVLTLSLEYAETLISSEIENITAAGVATRFDVLLDDNLISTVSLNSTNVGPQTLEIPIPPELLENPERRVHTMELEFSARDYCEVKAEARLEVNAEESAIRFTYEEAFPILDFAYYPIPLFNNPIGDEVETVIFVLPQNPSTSDLKAAASVAGGLGKLSGNSVNMRFALADEITNQDYRTHNMVFIGSLRDNSRVNDLYRRGTTQTQWNVDTYFYSGQDIDPDYGLIELVQHPDNPNKVILLVTGQTGLAIERAGQALGGRPSILNVSGSVGIISDNTALARRDTQNPNAPAGMYIIGNLNNLQDVVLSGYGTQLEQLDFDVPLGGDVRDDAFIEIIYNNSSILDDENTTLTIVINDVPISSTILQRNVTEVQTATDRVTAEGFRTLRIAVPEGVIVPGEKNTISFYADLEGDWECDIPDSDSIWVTISKQSFLFLPQANSADTEVYPVVAQFPQPFNKVPDLSNVLISLPEVVTNVEGEQLLNLVAAIADATRFGEGFRPEIIRGAMPEDIILQDYHMIVLGRPTTNTFLQQLNIGAIVDADGEPIPDNEREPYLPQPFLPNTDEVVQKYDDVTYALINRSAVGVLQSFVSPWNPNNRILVISGTEPLGQEAASDALLKLSFGRIQLRGDIVFATFTDAYPVDTREVFEPSEILQTAGELIATDTYVLPSTPVLVGTNTPLPITPTEAPTLGPVVTTFTPEPSPTLTPFPVILNIEDADDEDVAPANEGPDIMLIVIGISVAVVIIGGIYTLYAELRPKPKPTDEEDAI